MPNNKDTKIVFMGSPEFAIPSLKALLEAKYDLALVVSQDAKACGRGKRLEDCAVACYAQKNGLQLETPKRIKPKSGREFLDKVASLKPDFIVVAAYGKILPKRLLAIPKYGCINVHASLLPRWRGASPITHAILQGDDVSGVSIMEMTAGLDEGPVYLQDKIRVLSDDTTESLSQKLSHMGAKLLLQALPSIKNASLKALPQEDCDASYAPLLKKIDGNLDFNKSAKELERQIRAMFPWPCAYTSLMQKNLKIFKARAIPLEDKFKDCENGSILSCKNKFLVKCKDEVLQILSLQLEGKKAMEARNFTCGCRINDCEKLGS